MTPIRGRFIENAKLLAQHLKTPDNFYKLSEDLDTNMLSNIDGIGETQIRSIKNFFSNKINLEVLSELKKIINIVSAQSTNNTGILKNKTFMFTGKLKGISRAEAKSLIEKNSGKIVSNVNRKLDYLIVGEKPTARKVNNAKDLKINIISQNDWLKMLNNFS